MKLIAFEGINGAGKTTIMNKVYDWLQDQRLFTTIIKTKEPVGLFEKYLQSEDYSPRQKVFMYMAQRCYHYEAMIEPYTGSDNTCILTDRYMDSSIAYQVMGQKLNTLLINAMNAYATHDTRPYITIYLKLPVDLAMTRSQSTYSKQFLEDATLGYDILSGSQKDYAIIDASKPIDEVVKMVTDHIYSKCSSHLKD